MFENLKREISILKSLKKRIGVIGCGNMGSAIAQRLKAKYRVWLYDKDVSKTAEVPGVQVSSCYAELVREVDVVILAVKPQDFDALLQALVKETDGYILRRLVISIAAGITTSYIERFIPGIRVVRVMPNLAATIGASMTGLCRGSNSTKEDLILAKWLFGRLGWVIIVEEKLMNAVTVLSGSGIAFIYYLMEYEHVSPYDAEGFKVKYRDELRHLATKLFDMESKSAVELAYFTLKGAVALLRQSGQSTDELIKRIASKGGTTEAGLEVLRSGGTLKDAVIAAAKRAQELSKS